MAEHLDPNQPDMTPQRCAEAAYYAIACDAGRESNRIRQNFARCFLDAERLPQLASLPVEERQIEERRICASIAALREDSNRAADRIAGYLPTARWLLEMGEGVVVKADVDHFIAQVTDFLASECNALVQRLARKTAGYEQLLAATGVTQVLGRNRLTVVPESPAATARN